MAQEYSYCGALLRRHDADRYLTALFAPGERREALFALYAFNLEIARMREAVSEPMMGLIRLQWWRDALEARRDLVALRGVERERGPERAAAQLPPQRARLAGRLPAESRWCRPTR